MSKKLYISDTHWNHANIINFDNRPFNNVTEMNKAMITLWNETVDKKDQIYILGDFHWGKEPEWLEILKQLNGQKFLVIGNHDLKQMSSKLKSKFADITSYKEITDNGKHIIMSHYPIMCYKSSYNENTWMFHGHTHQSTFEQKWIEQWTAELVEFNKHNPYNINNKGHIINVGCMMPYVNYIPRTADELIEMWHKKYNVSY